MGYNVEVYQEVDGEERLVASANNLIVNAGLNAIAAIQHNPSSTQAIFNKMQTGTGTTSPTATDTALQTAVGSKETISDSDEGSGSGVWVLSHVFTYGSSYTITEAGIFDTPGTTMLARVTFTGVSVTTSKSLRIKWTFTATNA